MLKRMTTCVAQNSQTIAHKRKDGTPVNDEVALKIVSSIFLKHV